MYISKLTVGELSFFKLVSEAEETGLCAPLSETPKAGFVASRSIFQIDFIGSHFRKEYRRYSNHCTMQWEG